MAAHNFLQASFAANTRKEFFRVVVNEAAHFILLFAVFVAFFAGIPYGIERASVAMIPELRSEMERFEATVNKENYSHVAKIHKYTRLYVILGVD